MRSTLALELAAAFLLSACAQVPGSQAPRLAPPTEIDRLIPIAMAEAHANGIGVAVIDGGRIVYLHAFGRRNERGDPLREDTVMVAASLTKPVFAYLVMQWVDEGQIDLDAPIARDLGQPLPSYPAQRPYPAWSDLAGDERWRSITPRLLLGHRSGLPNLAALEPGGKIRLHFDPGTRFAYSGVGINLLQFVLEQGHGLDVEAELRRRVFQRFDMRDTSMTWQASHADNQADGTTSTGEARAHPRRQRAAAASSMDTTLQDYARFAAGFVRGDGLSAASAGALVASQGSITTATEFPTFQPELPAASRRPDLAAGLGVVVFDGPQGRGFFKGGHEDTAGNTLVCLVRPARCVVLLSNDVRAEKVFPGIVAAILGETGTPWNWEYGP